MPLVEGKDYSADSGGGVADNSGKDTAIISPSNDSETKRYSVEVTGGFEPPVSVESSVSSILPSNLDSPIGMISLRSPVAREWLARQRESIRPWQSFLDQDKFSKPSAPNQISERVQKNLKHFQSNYLVVVMILMGYCLITSPMLMVAFGAFFGVQYILNGNQGAQYQQKVFGKELTQTQQTVISACVSVPLFILAGATAAIFWVFGASVILVGAHGSLREPEVDPEEADTFLQETV